MKPVTDAINDRTQALGTNLNQNANANRFKHTVLNGDMGMVLDNPTQHLFTGMQHAYDFIRSVLPHKAETVPAMAQGVPNESLVGQSRITPAPTGPQPSASGLIHTDTRVVPTTPKQAVKPAYTVMQGGPVDPTIHDFIEQHILPYTRKAGIPDSVAAGQFAQEGRLKGLGAKYNNYYNVGLTDALVAEAEKTGDYSKILKYETPDAGVEGYSKFVTGQSEPSFYPNGEDGSKSGKIGRLQLVEIAKKYKNDPQGFLEAVGPMYSSQGTEYAKNVMNTPEFQAYLDPDTKKKLGLN